MTTYRLHWWASQLGFSLNWWPFCCYTFPNSNILGTYCPLIKKTIKIMLIFSIFVGKKIMILLNIFWQYTCMYKVFTLSNFAPKKNHCFLIMFLTKYHQNTSLLLNNWVMLNHKSTLWTFCFHILCVLWFNKWGLL